MKKQSVANYVVTITLSIVMASCDYIPYCETGDIIKIDSLHRNVVTDSKVVLYLHPHGFHSVKTTIKSEGVTVLKENNIHMLSHGVYPVKLYHFTGERWKRKKKIETEGYADIIARFSKTKFTEDDTLSLVAQDFPQSGDSLVMTIYTNLLTDYWKESVGKWLLL